MYSVSNAFLTALNQPSMISVVRITASDGTTLAIQNGSVSMDSRRNITRTAELELIPTSTKGLTDIYNLVMTPNVEITIARGLKLADGTTELIPLGVFSTDSAEYSKRVSGVISWSGSDRSKKISRAAFTDPYQITSGTTLAAAGTALLQSRYANVPTNFGNVLETINASITFNADENSDPWDNARTLFADHGYDLNFDGTGTARAQQVQDPASVPAVFNFGSGATNMITDAKVSGTLEKTYNGVIVTGEGSNLSSPIRGELWDTDPTSPTYYLGGFGKVPYFYSSPLITSSTLAQAVANVLLSKIKGRTDQLTWPAVVNPALEPLDVVSITIGGKQQNVVLDDIMIPLRAGDQMEATARQTTA